jgi:hypothetical protein
MKMETNQTGALSMVPTGGMQTLPDGAEVVSNDQNT